MKEYKITLKNELNVCMNDCYINNCITCKKCSWVLVGEGKRLRKKFGKKENIKLQNLVEMKAILKCFDDYELDSTNFIHYIEDQNSDYQLTDYNDKVLYASDKNMNKMYQDISTEVDDILRTISSDIESESLLAKRK